MATAHDVAAYILAGNGPMTAMKLQKLCYYSQAFSLAWFNEPVFNNRIEAWTNGPVVRDLWLSHKGQFNVSEISEGNPEALSNRERGIIDAVLEAMGGLTGKQLSDRTHSEGPWAKNYDGDDAFPNGEITHEELAHYYRQVANA